MSTTHNIDASGCVLVPIERLRALEALEARANSVFPTIDLPDTEGMRAWCGELPRDAPTPGDEAMYNVRLYNDMGHLGFDIQPSFRDDYMLYSKVSPYVRRDIHDVYETIDGNVYTFIKRNDGVPIKRNVSVKWNDAWITVCLDYSSLE
jgi:hypothetical protein